MRATRNPTDLLIVDLAPCAGRDIEWRTTLLPGKIQGEHKLIIDVTCSTTTPTFKLFFSEMPDF